MLSKKLESNTNLSFRTEQGILTGEVLLLPIQEWFFDRNFVVPNHWNQSFLIKVSTLNLDTLRMSVVK